jgi:hypothetical protein
MPSYWDRTDARRRQKEERQRALTELQMEMWGWTDQRLRDGTGRLLRPRPDRRSGRGERERIDRSMSQTGDNEETG